MRISTRGVYALEAMLAIGLQDPAETVSVRSISDLTGLSDSYLEQIFTLLKRSELVVSSRGNRGGYHLARPAATITAGDILRATEGPLTPVHCVSNELESCERYDSCLTRPIWQTLAEEISRFVDCLSLADLVGRYQAQSADQPVDFII